MQKSENKKTRNLLSNQLASTDDNLINLTSLRLPYAQDGWASLTYTGDNGDNTVLGEFDQENSLFGNDGDDFLVGGDLDDELNGGTGNDVLVGLNGDDKIIGDDGNDTLYGYEGDDQMWGEEGNDTLKGGDGDDYVDGGGGYNTMYGGKGNDHLVTAAGWSYTQDNTMYGEDGNDRIIDGDGNSILYGGQGKDEISGGRGHDFITGDEGDDELEGEDGNDTLMGGVGNDLLAPEGYNAEYYKQLEKSGGKLPVADGNVEYDRVDGGDGLDTLVLEAHNTQYSYKFDEQTHTVYFYSRYKVNSNGSSYERDTCEMNTNIEYVYFGDYYTTTYPHTPDIVGLDFDALMKAGLLSKTSENVGQLVDRLKSTMGGFGILTGPIPDPIPHSGSLVFEPITKPLP
ncbi:MAG: hypothetical protein K1X44_08945 [Alphaproteobacteria bacterium]|nr:hypothetical protein [Alphaproteobacteria bacterium]